MDIAERLILNELDAIPVTAGEAEYITQMTVAWTKIPDSAKASIKSLYAHMSLMDNLLRHAKADLAQTAVDADDETKKAIDLWTNNLPYSAYGGMYGADQIKTIVMGV